MREVGFETGAEGEGAEREGGVGEEEEEVGGGGGVVDWGGDVSWGVLTRRGREGEEGIQTILRDGRLGRDSS